MSHENYKYKKILVDGEFISEDEAINYIKYAMRNRAKSKKIYYVIEKYIFIEADSYLLFVTNLEEEAHKVMRYFEKKYKHAKEIQINLLTVDGDINFFLNDEGITMEQFNEIVKDK